LNMTKDQIDGLSDLGDIEWSVSELVRIGYLKGIGRIEK
jgi:hypothetical protein